jgi:hypothetical protein
MSMLVSAELAGGCGRMAWSKAGFLGRPARLPRQITDGR